VLWENANTDLNETFFFCQRAFPQHLGKDGGSAKRWPMWGEQELVLPSLRVIRAISGRLFSGYNPSFSSLTFT